jgi:hypothetical protein
MPSATNLEEEEIVDAPGNNGNASMPEQVKRPNPWMMMMMILYFGEKLFFTGVACLERTALQYFSLGWLASNILPWMPGFSPRQYLMEFVVENMALQVLWFYPFIIISPELFICCWHYIVLAVDNKALKIQFF